MLGKAGELGCPPHDPDCLCSNADFQHGLRDCTHEACPGEKVEQVVQAGLQACREMGGAPGSCTFSLNFLFPLHEMTILTPYSHWCSYYWHRLWHYYRNSHLWLWLRDHRSLHQRLWLCPCPNRKFYLIYICVYTVESMLT